MFPENAAHGVKSDTQKIKKFNRCKHTSNIKCNNDGELGRHGEGKKRKKREQKKRKGGCYCVWLPSRSGWRQVSPVTRPEPPTRIPTEHPSASMVPQGAQDPSRLHASFCSSGG